MKNKKLIPLYALAGIIICAVIIFCTGTNSYPLLMTKAVRSAMGKDFKEYHCPSYPTNNFGLLTTYQGSVSDKNQLCAMADCFDSLVVNDDKMGGLASVGEGPAISLNKKDQNFLAIDAVLPELWQMLGISAGVNKREIINIAMKLGPTIERHLNKMKFIELINSLPAGNLYKTGFISGNLAVVIADVVVKDMEITISVEDSVAIKLDAKINTAVTETQGSLKGEFKRISTGQYSFKINHPLIVLRLVRKQPQGGVLSQSDNFDDWTLIEDRL